VTLILTWLEIFSGDVECVIIIISSSIVVILLVFSQRPSILQVFLCILCNYNKYPYTSSIRSLYIHITTHNLKISTFSFFTAACWVQHFPYMCENFTIYIPKLLLFSCGLFNPPAQEKGVLKWCQLQSIKHRDNFISAFLHIVLH
jgi:hypothetical protein